MKQTEKSIQNMMDRTFSNHEYVLHNAFIFDSQCESDWFGLSVPKGYAYEVEIKISRSDFKADFKKPRHNTYINAAQQKNGFVPNLFYYAVPHGMVKEHELPPYAGLIYVNENGCTFIKKAPYIHKNSLNIDKILKEKFYHRYLKYKYTAEKATFEQEQFTKEYNRMKALLKILQKPKSPKRIWQQHQLFQDPIKIKGTF